VTLIASDLIASRTGLSGIDDPSALACAARPSIDVVRVKLIMADRKDDEAMASPSILTNRILDFDDSMSFRSGRRASNASSAHITMAKLPPRPKLPSRGTAARGTASSRNITEAMRLARSREEQETLLGDEEQADDDGCYPPRQNDDPRKPNPHSALPVYTTIHMIRRLVLAAIGTWKRDNWINLSGMLIAAFFVTI
jgi:hypothetical protein